MTENDKLSLPVEWLEKMMEEYANAPKEEMGKRTPGERGMYEIQRAERCGKRWNAGRMEYEPDVSN